MYVWTVASQARFARPVFFSGSCSLFMGPVSTFLKKKNNFKTGFYGTFHTFKNYFVTVFSIFSF